MLLHLRYLISIFGSRHLYAAQYHTIWYRALQLDQSEDGGNLLSETMVQYWNDEITLDELVDRLTPRLKLYLDE